MKRQNRSFFFVYGSIEPIEATKICHIVSFLCLNDLNNSNIISRSRPWQLNLTGEKNCSYAIYLQHLLYDKDESPGISMRCIATYQSFTWMLCTVCHYLLQNIWTMLTSTTYLNQCVINRFTAIFNRLNVHA